MIHIRSRANHIHFRHYTRCKQNDLLHDDPEINI